MKTFLRILLWTFAASSAALAVSADEAPSNSQADFTKLFALFDSLGFPDLKNAPLVCLTSWPDSWPDSSQRIWVLDGFLLSEEDRSFRILTLDLFEVELSKKCASVDGDQAIGYAAYDYQKEISGRMKELRERLGALVALRSKAGKTEERSEFDARELVFRGPERGPGRRLGVRAELVFLAWVSARKGMENLDRELCDVARELPYDDLSHLTSGGQENLEKLERQGGLIFDNVVRYQVAHALTWNAVVAFENPNVTWENHLHAFERIDAHFPESPYVDRVKEAIAVLKKMIQDETEARAVSQKPWVKMTTEERAAALVFQLRNQNGRQWSQPGRCEIFNDPRGEESPAARLAAMGYDAVPQLIEVLDNCSFTRSVDYGRDFFFSHQVLRVGDCALVILERIAGKDFYSTSHWKESAVETGDMVEVKRAILEWWAQFQGNGEKQVLIEATRTGQHDCIGQARQLAEKYPDVALDAIKEGLQRISEPIGAEPGSYRAAFVGLVRLIPGPEADAFLLQQLNSGADLFSRVAAAEALHARGRPEAVPAMIHEWKEIGVSRKGYEEHRPWLDPDVSKLIRFLAGSGRVEAIGALTTESSRRRVIFRTEIIRYLGYALHGAVSTASRPASPDGAAVEQVRFSPEVVEAIESFLISALDDAERTGGATASESGPIYVRVCDDSAHSLAWCWPQKYAFDLIAQDDKRDRQIAAIKEAYAKAKHTNSATKD
ncbi:MAG: hypothetical protein HY706_18200 [Candidatus Hydrogenedentes bacterium]|nr:hypothetical protein [Candidatus Hydrogenedentota bacterium]